MVLLTIDCLRADHLSCMGYKTNTSPFMDSLAEKGTLFTQTFINGVGTCASFSALMTSTYPFMHGGYESIKNRKTLAKALKERGYKTAGFNDNGFLAPYFGYHQGFDHFDWMGKAKNESKATNVTRKLFKLVSRNEIISKYIMSALSSINILKDREMEGEDIKRRVFSWLENSNKNEFFMWIHFMDVHGPHYAPKSYLQEVTNRPPSKVQLIRLLNKIEARDPSQTYLKGKISTEEINLFKTIYDAEIRYIDDCIKEIYNKLKTLGLDKDTAIIVTGDHGEEFFEHGRYHWHGNMYDEMLRIPLIIYGPNIERNKIEKQVEQIDIAPTIIDLLSQKKEDMFVGKSLLSDNVESNYVISEVAHDYVSKSSGQRIVNVDFGLRKSSVRCTEADEKWKYINCTKENSEELYNLNTDPFEKNNLVGEEGKAKEYLRKLRKKLDNHIKTEEEQRRIRERIKMII